MMGKSDSIHFMPITLIPPLYETYRTNLILMQVFLQYEPTYQIVIICQKMYALKLQCDILADLI